MQMYDTDDKGSTFAILRISSIPCPTNLAVIKAPVVLMPWCCAD